MARVLIVDDENSIRITLQEFLSEVDYQVEVAEDAEQAMVMLSAKDFDVVVTDIIMPRITGVKLLKAIKETSFHTQVILMTGEPTVKTAAEAVRAGAFDYLSKPISKESLLKTVANAVKIKSLDDERRRLAEENQQYQDNLEQLVEQRTTALQKSEARYRAIISAQADLLCRYSLDGKITFANNTYCHFFGINYDEVLGVSYFDHIPLEAQSAVRDMIANLSAENPILTGENSNKDVQGKSYWLHWSNQAILNDDGQIIEYQAVGRDISERKQAEESLRLLNQAMEYSPTSIIITDTNGIIQYVNPRFSQVSGYSAAETIGKTPRVLKSGKQTREFYQELWDTIIAGEEWRGEFNNRKKTGELYWDLASISGVKDQTGKITHFVSVQEDITQRKQREEAHVRQERLAAVGQLAAGIAHDFNNVMTVISLYSDLLQKSDNLPKKDINKLQIIHQQAHHAANLTQQILDFSRRSVREPRPIDMKVFLNEILKFIERTIPEHIQVQFTFTRGSYMLNADPTQLQQVITNLTVNARDALPTGGMLYFNLSRLTLAVDETPPCPSMKPGEWVQLTVTDTGTGIDPKVLPQIFEPFVTTKEVGQGTGLGLAQVYGIVKQHKGCIMVNSQLKEGTTFDIYLPALMQETAVNSIDSLTGIPLGQGETILLVDDNQILLEATRAVLKSLNYRVVTAKDGVEALNLYCTQSDQIDLILTDVVMPKMDGFELVTALQQQSLSSKVLMMSGFSRNVEISPESKQLIVGWLKKPLNMNQLAETVQEILDDQQ